MEKIDKSNTFQLVLDDAVILASDEYKLEDVYSAFKRFFVENGAKDISEIRKNLFLIIRIMKHKNSYTEY